MPDESMNADLPEDERVARNRDYFATPTRTVNLTHDDLLALARYIVRGVENLSVRESFNREFALNLTTVLDSAAELAHADAKPELGEALTDINHEFELYAL